MYYAGTQTKWDKQIQEGQSMCRHGPFQIREWLYPAVTVSSWYIEGEMIDFPKYAEGTQIHNGPQSNVVSSVLTWRDGDLYEQEGESSSEG